MLYNILMVVFILLVVIVFLIGIYLSILTLIMGSYSNLGNFYELPTGFEGKASQFLAGDAEFDLAKLEAYMINFE